MKKTKQIISVFLSVCIVISCMVGFSVTAFAVTKPIAADEKYEINDTIDFGDITYFAFSGLTDKVYSLSGSQKLTFGGYDETTGLQTLNIGDNFPIKLNNGTSDPASGISCKSGSGTQSVPFVLSILKPYTGFTDPPTAKEGLVYNGQNQTLLNEGSGIKGGDTEPVSNVLYIPSRKDQGTYYVWYTVIPDD